MEKEMLLEKYLKGKLTIKEKQGFEILLKTDLMFRKEVEFQKDVKRVVTLEEDEAFRNVLYDFESEAQAKEQKKIFFSYKWLIVAASIILLFVLTYFFTVYQTSKIQELYSENFKPYRNVTHPITRGEEFADDKTKAFLAYTKGEYKESIELFTKLYTSGKEPYYLFYKANALIQLNRATEAIPLLQEHLRSSDVLSDKSNWYLAMSYLQIEDIEKAKRALNLVVKNKTYKTKQAKKLLDAL